MVRIVIWLAPCREACPRPPKVLRKIPRWRILHGSLTQTLGGMMSDARGAWLCRNAGCLLGLINYIRSGQLRFSLAQMLWLWWPSSDTCHSAFFQICTETLCCSLNITATQPLNQWLITYCGWMVIKYLGQHISLSEAWLLQCYWSSWPPLRMCFRLSIGWLESGQGSHTYTSVFNWPWRIWRKRKCLSHSCENKSQQILAFGERPPLVFTVAIICNYINKKSGKSFLYKAICTIATHTAVLWLKPMD